MLPWCLHLRRDAAILLAVCLGALLPGKAGAQPSPFTPYELRALYLYNFAKFTTWPDKAFSSPNDRFVVGILGVDPFKTNSNIINGKALHGRTVTVKTYATVDEIDHCHLLFISDSEKDRLPEILKALENSSILVVAEMEGFVDEGGMVNLLMEKKNLTFEINQAVGEKARLKFDIRLLRLAKRVKQ